MRRRRLPPILLLLSLLLGVLTAPGCGYRSMLGDGEPVRGGDAEGETADPQASLAVLTLRNDSPEPWLDRIVSDAMRREMSARGRFDLIDDPNEADLVLRGRIRPLEVRAKSFSTFVSALEYEVTLVLDVEIVRSTGASIRLDEGMLSETDVYFASADIEVTRSNRLESLRRMSDLMASRVADTLELIERPIEDVDDEGAG